MARHVNKGPGGRIAPQGRPSRAKGIGKNSKRHDLERPKTPGLQNSDLQQGDVQRLEQAQRVAPIKEQRPAASTGGGVRRSTGGSGGNRGGEGLGSGGGVRPPSDPIGFAKGRLSGTLDRSASRSTAPALDPTPWLPLLRAMANDPNSSALLTQAYLNAANRALRPTVQPAGVVDLGEFDSAMGQVFGDN